MRVLVAHGGGCRLCKIVAAKFVSDSLFGMRICHSVDAKGIVS